MPPDPFAEGEGHPLFGSREDFIRIHREIQPVEALVDEG
jgi:hypothetical protein